MGIEVAGELVETAQAEERARIVRLKDLAKKLNKSGQGDKIDLDVDSPRVLRDRIKTWLAENADVEAETEPKSKKKGKAKPEPDEDEEEEEEDEDEEEEEVEEKPEWLKVGKRVKVNVAEDEDAEEEWEYGVVETINEKKGMCSVEMDDGTMADAPFGALKPVKPKAK